MCVCVCGLGCVCAAHMATTRSALTRSNILLVYILYMLAFFLLAFSSLFRLPPCFPAAYQIGCRAYCIRKREREAKKRKKKCIESNEIESVRPQRHLPSPLHHQVLVLPLAGSLTNSSTDNLWPTLLRSRTNWKGEFKRLDVEVDSRDRITIANLSRTKSDFRRAFQSFLTRRNS